MYQAMRRGLLFIVLMGSLSCSKVSPSQQGSLPILPVGIPSPLLIPPDLVGTSSVTPEFTVRIPFAYPPGPCSELFLYDDASKDIWVYPGAGKGVQNVYELNPRQYYFDRDGRIYIYDAIRECLLNPIETQGVVRFAFFPAYDGNHNLYFVGTNDPLEALAGVGKLFAAFTPFGPSAPATSSLGPPCTLFELAKPNAIDEGGITSASVTSAGSLMAFTTACGGLYLYTPFEPALFKLPIGPSRAISAAIDPVWGRYVAWEDIDAEKLFVLDRWTGCIDPVPFANVAENLIGVSMHGFLNGDPWHLFFFAALPGERFAPQLLCYNIITETVRTLSILNAVSGLFSGENNILISDPD